MTKVKGLQIYDNFLCSEYLNFLKNTFIFSGNIDWKINLSSRGDVTPLSERIFDTQCICELIRTPYFISPDAQVLIPFIDIIPNLYRAKVNVTFPSENTHVLGHHTDQPQLDGSHDYYSGIFYINDSNGHTELIDPKKKKKHEVECKENRLVLFPGCWSHSGTTPTNVKARYVINFVFFGDIHPENIKETEKNYLSQIQA